MMTDLNLSNIFKMSQAESRSLTAENFRGKKGKGGMATKDTTLTSTAAKCARELAVITFILFFFFSAQTNASVADSGNNGDFFVATNGKDADPGTLEKPFATIQRAQVAVRKKIETSPDQPVTVLIRGGRYELIQPLLLTSADSGSHRACITYAAYPNEIPRLSGGHIISGWTKSKNNTWATVLPEVKKGRWYFRQLYVDGNRLERGQFPSGDLLQIKNVSEDVKEIEFDRELPINLGNRDVELIVIQNWSIARSVIASSQDKTVTCKTPLGWVGHRQTTALPGKYAYLENDPAFLTKPGQWHLDRKSGVLTYKAAKNENPDQMQFIAPSIPELLNIQGSRKNPVRNICFQGLVFEHAAWLLPDRGYAGIQAGYNDTSYGSLEYFLPVAVKLSYAEDCIFKHCQFVHIGPSAIGLSAGTRRNRIVACEVGDVGGNGIHIGLPNKSPIPRLSNDWDDLHDVPTDNEVSNCYLHHCAAENFGCVGLFAAFSANTRFQHNHVCNMPYTGISVGFRWNTSPTSQKHCRVEYNHIHDIMTKLYDGGGIYTLGLQPGSILRGNHIYNIHRSTDAHGTAPNNGIFFDQGSMGFLVEDNVIYKTSGDSIRFNQVKKEWQTWRNNSLGKLPEHVNFPEEIARFAGIHPRVTKCSDQ